MLNQFFGLILKETLTELTLEVSMSSDNSLGNAFFDAIQNLIHDNVTHSGLDMEDPEVLNSIIYAVEHVKDYFDSLKESVDASPAGD